MSINKFGIVENTTVSIKKNYVFYCKMLNIVLKHNQLIDVMESDGLNRLQSKNLNECDTPKKITHIHSFLHRDTSQLLLFLLFLFPILLFQSYVTIVLYIINKHMNQSIENGSYAFLSSHNDKNYFHKFRI